MSFFLTAKDLTVSASFSQKLTCLLELRALIFFLPTGQLVQTIILMLENTVTPADESICLLAVAYSQNSIEQKHTDSGWRGPPHALRTSLRLNSVRAESLRLTQGFCLWKSEHLNHNSRIRGLWRGSDVQAFTQAVYAVVLCLWRWEELVLGMTLCTDTWGNHSLFHCRFSCQEFKKSLIPIWLTTFKKKKEEKKTPKDLIFLSSGMLLSLLMFLK